MFRLVRGFSLAIIVSLAWTCASYAQSVPITLDGPSAGAGGGAVRGTCDPGIEEMIKNQAWEAGQREITQNENLYARPDSVLSLSCFDSWLDHQATYAANNFPVDPDESEGLLLGGLMTDLLIVLPDDIITSVDPNLTTGYVQYGILEILVLDQLENVGSITGQVADAPGFALCGAQKHYYIDTNFPDLMLGDRAKTKGAVPAYSQIRSWLDTDVSDSSSYRCTMMNDVWHRTKCYDFATEESSFYASAGAYTGVNHDGFYTYDDYTIMNDVRREPEICRLPNNNIIEVPPAADLACWIQVHGMPGNPADSSILPTFSLTGGMTWPGGGKSWGQMHTDANPPAGTPGGGDAYDHQLATVSGDPAFAPACATPIRTGYLVVRNRSQYYDAVCPNPGCFFNPPANITGTGSCSR